MANDNSTTYSYRSDEPQRYRQRPQHQPQIMSETGKLPPNDTELEELCLVH